MDNPSAEDRRGDDVQRAVETARQQRLEDAVEEYDRTGHIGTPLEERERTDEALRSQYEQAIADQPPLIDPPVPEQPLIKDEPALSPAGSAAFQAAVKAADAYLSTRTGVPDAATTVVKATENVIEARDVEGGVAAQAATAGVGFAVDMAATNATPPGTVDLNVDALAEDIKDSTQPHIEAAFGKASPDDDPLKP
jgi:hypothetical protein